MNNHLIMSCKVCYFSLAKKNYPTAVINPGSTYRAPVYSPVTITGQCFYDKGALNRLFFNVSMEWMLVSGNVQSRFLSVCLGKCVSVCVRGRGES